MDEPRIEIDKQGEEWEATINGGYFYSHHSLAHLFAHLSQWADSEEKENRL